MAPINLKPNQFGSLQPVQTVGSGSGAFDCSQCEAMLADLLDGTLSETDQAAIDLHLVGCTACSSMVADAQRGHAWLEMLRDPRPEPSAALLNRILLQTSGIQSSGVQAGGVLAIVDTSLSLPSSPALPGVSAPSPFLVSAAATPIPRNVLPFRARAVTAFRQTIMQPRLAMTAAMAFFSVALTLNLTGIHLSQLRASDLRPSSLRRDFYDANARAVRTFDNLRVVYELESRVRDIQRASDSDTSAQSDVSSGSAKPTNETQPGQKPDSNRPIRKQDQKPAAKPGGGSSLRNAPGHQQRFFGSNPALHCSGNPVLTAFLPRPTRTEAEGGLV